MDGGPRRQQLVPGGLHVGPDDRLAVTNRHRASGDHAGRRARRRPPPAAPHRGRRRHRVRRAHRPAPLETAARSPDLAGRPRLARWPRRPHERLDRTSCSATTRTGSRRAHGARIDRAAAPRPSVQQLRGAPDGHLVTKDFGGVAPGGDPARTDRNGRAPRARSGVARRSSPGARCPSRRSRACRPTATPCTSSARRRSSASAGTARADARSTTSSCPTAPSPARRTGGTPCSRSAPRGSSTTAKGSERYTGTFRGQGISTAPLHLVRVDLATRRGHAHRDLRARRRTRREPAGGRRAAAHRRRLRQRQRRHRRLRTRHARARRPRDQDHACHLLLFEDTGELVTGDGMPTSSCSTSPPAPSSRVPTAACRCSRKTFPTRPWARLSTSARSSRCRASRWSARPSGSLNEDPGWRVAWVARL